jgi:hypothetical protein
MNRCAESGEFTLFVGRDDEEPKKKSSAGSLRTRECTYSVSRRIRTAD